MRRPKVPWWRRAWRFISNADTLASLWEHARPLLGSALVGALFAIWGALERLPKPLIALLFALAFAVAYVIFNAVQDHKARRSKAPTSESLPAPANSGASALEDYEQAIRRAAAAGITSPDGTNRFFPITVRQGPPPLPININSLGAYIRGHPTVREIMAVISMNLAKPVEDVGPASIAHVEQAQALGISTIADLDRQLIEDEKLVVRMAAYVIPNKLPADFCIQCLFWVIGGRMGAEAYAEAVKGLPHSTTDPEEMERIYGLISSY